MKLTETELRISVNALHVAADVFKTDADAYRRADAATADKKTEGGVWIRLARQFDQQASEARTLAEKITAEIG